MTSMNISLPEPLKLFVEEQVSTGRYRTASEYLGELIREAQRRADRHVLEAMLLAGLQSPTSEITADEWSLLRERILSRSPELQVENTTRISQVVEFARIPILESTTPSG